MQILAAKEKKDYIVIELQSLSSSEDCRGEERNI
jgi:hypothetical protein